MNALILMAALVWGTPAVADGSVLFLENSNLFVKLYTGSGVTHAAIVVHEKDEAWVYEATPSEVRRVKLDDYYAELGRINARRPVEKKIRVWLVQPRQEYSARQLKVMKVTLAAELGRRYSVKGYVRGRSDGIHCAELVAKTLVAGEALALERCQDESPGSLLKRLEPQSRPLATIRIDEPVEERAWSTTAWERCTSACDWCSWACWESWTWCW